MLGPVFGDVSVLRSHQETAFGGQLMGETVKLPMAWLTCPHMQFTAWEKPKSFSVTLIHKCRLRDTWCDNDRGQ